MVQNIRQSRFFRVVMAVLGLLTFTMLVVYIPIVRNKSVFSRRLGLTVEDCRRYGLAAEEIKDWEDAAASYRRLLELKKDDVYAQERLPWVYLQAGNKAMARDYAEKLITTRPDSPIGYFYLGVIYNLENKEDMATNNFKKAIQIDPKYAEAYFNLGFLSESKGSLHEAISFYRKALEADPKHARAAYNLGNAYAGLDRLEEAIDAYKNAIAIDPYYADAMVNLSILLTRSNRYPEAIKYLDEAQMLGYEPPAEYTESLKPYRKETAVTK